MGSQTKDFSLGYLKVAVHLINEKPEEMDLKLGRPMRLEDLDNLSSENMVKIVVYLLMDVIGDKPISKITSLSDFNKFSVGELTYDCAVDQIYHAVKQIFPMEDEVFHYSVLLFPAKDPKRTKHVISYIMSFFLMCDDLHDSFSSCFTEVLTENEEKAGLCNEIGDLKESIANIIQQRERESQQLPMLQKEIRTIEEGIRQQQGVLSNLTRQMEKHKADYETKEIQIRQLEKHLEQMDLEMRSLAGQIVPNPNEMRAENVRIKKELEVHSKQRGSIGYELEKLRKDCAVFESLTDRAKDAIHNFEAVIAAMNSAKAKIESYTKSGNEQATLLRKLGHLKIEGEQLAQRHNEKTREADSRLKQHQSKKAKVQDEIKNLREEIEEIRDKTKTAVYETVRIRESFGGMEEEIKNLQIQITQYIHDITVSIPQQREVEDEKQIKLLEEVSKKFRKSPFALSKKD